MQGNDRFYIGAEKAGKRMKNNLLVIVFVLIALILGGALVKSGNEVTERKVALDGEVLLNGDISFEEADAKLREAGFEPLDGNVFQLEGQIQDYKGRKVYGHKAILSVLGYTAVGEKSNMLAIMHYFLEDSSANREHPGENFTDVREKLTQSLGKEPTEEEGFLNWQLKGGSSAMMGYIQDGLWMLVYAYTK